MADKQSRKYQLTINNPADKGLDHDALKKALEQFKSCVYWCMADEVGLDTHTAHTHLFFCLKSPGKWSTVKKRFPEAHIEAAKGTIQENRDYVAKSGKWAEDPKADTSVPGTFEESGEPPEEQGQGARTDLMILYQMIKDGMSNYEIIEANPDYMLTLDRIERVRQMLREEQYRETFRQLEVTYIWGNTGLGKSRYVMEKYGYSEVYRVTDYEHPFDTYSGQDVLLLGEYGSNFKVRDLLNFLDGYPLMLPCRYANRVACYTKVYMISNISLKEQYPNIQREEEQTWKALLRRISRVIEYRATGPPIDHGPALDYIFPPPSPVPDWVTEAEEAEQSELPFP